MGGSFSEDIQNCTLEFQLPHLGIPELNTGFRVLREF